MAIVGSKKRTSERYVIVHGIFEVDKIGGVVRTAFKWLTLKGHIGKTARVRVRFRSSLFVAIECPRLPSSAFIENGRRSWQKATKLWEVVRRHTDLTSDRSHASRASATS